MGDKHRGFSLGHGAVFAIDVVFRNGIESGGGLVQHQNGAVFIEGSCQHEPLGLAAGEEDAVQMDFPAHVGVNPLGQCLDGFGEPGLFQTVPNPFRIDILWLLGHIFGHRSGKQGIFLEYRAEQSIIAVPVKGFNIGTVQKNRSFRGVEQAAQELHQGRFARTVQAHNGEFLPRVHRQA